MRSGGTRTNHRPTAIILHRARWLNTSAWSLVVGTGLCALAYPLRQYAGESLLVLGMVALVVAWFTATLGWVVGRGRRFALVPKSRAGWLSLALLVLGWLMTVLPENVTVRTRAAMDLLGEVVVSGIGVTFLAGMVTLWAMWRQGERSAPLILIGGFAALFGPFFLLSELVVLP